MQANQYKHLLVLAVRPVFVFTPGHVERYEFERQIRHSENKNVMKLTLSESEVKAAVQ